jgi:type IV pilus assembly protein PilA
MKKKGFTLVELLAVIVILAIIALIAIPSILKMIKKQPEEEHAITLHVGDYVKMTPTSTSYTIAASDTGCTISTNCDGYTDQTITPSELTLWRVIRVNEDDNTYDAVSVYTSSTKVSFYGQTGYQKFVGTLNKIAKQYENSNYTTGSRMIGYNGQTEEITTALTQANSGTESTYDMTITTTTEAKGAGDDWYTTDRDLVNNVFGSGRAYIVNDPSTWAEDYWLASRHYNYYSPSEYNWGLQYWGDTVLYAYFVYGKGDDSLPGYGSSMVRPIITLKSELYADGTGTETDPYILHQKS